MTKNMKKNLKGGRGALAVALVLMLVAVLFLSACPAPSPPPLAEQKFSLGITDNSGANKNGVSILTLTFDETATPDATTVVAKRGSPIIDGKDGDAAWGPASEIALLLPVLEGGGPTTATVKAAYDDDNIYFLVKWEDPTGTESIHKKMWTYNAADGTWTQSGDEDRVYFLFNINATDFDVGCAVYCHVGAPAWDVTETKMGTNNPGETIDVWHWKAHRTNSTNHAEDKHWVDLTGATELVYDAEIVLRTRIADAGDGFASGNKEAGLPEYMHKNDPGANVDFLFEADAVPFDSNADWSDGDTVPGYILTEGTGSRADVIAVATYSDGTWVVEFQRSLITNNPDDVQFE